MIKAITFDLWDTVFIDDTDEPKRKAANRPSKSIARRQLVHQFLEKYQPIDGKLVNAVYDTTDAAFRKVWHSQHVTWSVRDRIDIILKGLHRDLSQKDKNELVKLHEEMELEFRPDFVPGVHEAIKNLHGTYKLAVISDAIFSPGRCLRTLLKDEGLLEYFDLFIFSDEIGNSKPEPRIFQAAWEGLGLAPEEVVHIGDREHNDILGPLKAGMHCILCTAAIDRDSKNTMAKFMFDDYKNLPTIVDQLNESLTN
jgi:putative hydrolase of the HAD superfamily